MNGLNKLLVLLKDIISFSDTATLPAILLFIGIAVLVVFCFRRVNLSPVLGYLCAGILVGEHGLDIIPLQKTSFIAEFGVVFLLFTIGLELSFARLKDMRKYVLGLGSLQIIVTFLIFFAISQYLFGFSHSVSIVIAGGISLSSTAVVLQVIKDLHKQSTQLGRISLAVLLQQDFFVIPLIVLVPILSSSTDNKQILLAVAVSLIKALLALIGIFIFGRTFLRPLFRTICSTNDELFVATTLLLVLSSAWITGYLGLSLELGAFTAGILIAETEFRNQAERSISPFKDILLGLFFMSVGMTINITYIYNKINLILLYTSCIILIKFLVNFFACYIFKLNKSISLQAGLLLAQGSEFSFVLCNIAVYHKVIDSNISEMMLVVVTISMALTPMLSLFGSYLSKKFSSSELSSIELIRSNSIDLTNHVIILGFTEASEMASSMLSLNEISHVIIDSSERSVKSGTDRGFPTFLGDGDNLEALQAAGIKRAMGVLVTFHSSNPIMLIKFLKNASKNFPQIPLIVFSKNCRYKTKLYEAGATTVVPATYEAGLELASVFLRDKGLNPVEISNVKNVYRNEHYSKIIHQQKQVE